MQEYRFTSSMIAAVDFALRLAQGKLQNPKPELNCPAPAWTNFSFFGRISASKLHHVERLKNEEGEEWGWKVQRTVKFYYLNQCVLEMLLEGNKWDKAKCQGIHPDRLSAWAVTWFRYVREFDGRNTPIFFTNMQIPDPCPCSRPF